MALDVLTKTFLCGEVLTSESLNTLIQSINNTIDFVNNINTNLNEHKYDVSIPITSIYCRTKKDIAATHFFPQSEEQRSQLFNLVSNCEVTLGIKYDSNFVKVLLSDNADAMNGIWTSYPLGITEELPHEWTVSFKKLDNGEILYMFGPVLTSNYGYSGEDGDSIQYVYKLFDRELTEEERVNYIPTKPIEPNANGEYIPNGWTDNPQGPTSEFPYEYVSKLKRIQGNWGNFEKIALWSTYSEDGVNGDFQIRVFCRYTPTITKLTPNKPIGGTYESPYPGSNDGIVWTSSIPSGEGLVWTSSRIFKGNGNAITEWSTPVIESDTNEIDIEYSSSFEKPDVSTLRTIPSTSNPSNNIWHDPSEQGIDLSTMVWRAERKIKNGKYVGNWVITRLTGMRGSFKSMVFRRFTPSMIEQRPATPSGGTYSNPIPSGGLWEDGIPYGDGPIWASFCIFTEDDTEPVPSTRWSSPQLQSDSEELDIEFSPNETLPANPSGEPFSNREGNGWYNPTSANFNLVGPMIWRAERKVTNGIYLGAWTVTRITGEKGEEGKRGGFKSCVFKRSASVISFVSIADDAEVTYENPIPNGWSDGIPEGTDILWMAVSNFTGNGDEHTSWTVTQQTDSVDLDIEFSPSEVQPQLPTGGPFTDRSSQGWYDASNIPENTKMIWRAERKVHNLVYEGDWIITRIYGEKGDSATLNNELIEILEKAGIEVFITPSNIMLDLAGVLVNASDDKIDNVTANIIVHQNGIELTNDKYRIIEVKLFNENSNEIINVDNKYIVFTGDYNLNKSVTIKNLPISSNSEEYTYTYNKGFISGILEIKIGENSYNVSFQIPWYLNKLGEREAKILGDVETIYMTRNIFKGANDPNNPNDLIIQLNFLTMILQGALSTLEQYGVIEEIENSVPKAYTNKFAEYVRSAEENSSRLSKGFSGTNLLPGNNWTNIEGDIIAFNSALTIYSPFIYLEPGVYIFSCYSLALFDSSNTTNNLNLLYRSSSTKPNKPSEADAITSLGVTHRGILVSGEGYSGDYYTVDNIDYPRWYIKLLVEEAKYYTLCLTSELSGRKYYRPQLELCVTNNETPTAWVPGPLEYSSEIKLTANSINLIVSGVQSTAESALSTANNINTNLTQTGITISGENRGINMYADNFRLNDSLGNMVFGKDSNSNNIKFTGDVQAKSLTAGNSNELHIVTENNALKFMNGNNCVGRFVIDGNGLMFYLLDKTGTEYAVNFLYWNGTVSFTLLKIYTLASATNTGEIIIYKRDGYYYDQPSTSAGKFSSPYNYFIETGTTKAYYIMTGVLPVRRGDYLGETQENTSYSAFPVTIKIYAEASFTSGELSYTGNYKYIATNFPDLNWIPLTNKTEYRTETGEYFYGYGTAVGSYLSFKDPCFVKPSEVTNRCYYLMEDWYTELYSVKDYNLLLPIGSTVVLENYLGPNRFTEIDVNDYIPILADEDDE